MADALPPYAPPRRPLWRRAIEHRATMGALRDGLRSPTVWIFALLVAAYIVPLWTFDYLPFMDLPQHLATISVLRGYDDPALGYAAYFQVDLLSTPYLLYYLTTEGLAILFGVEAASRLFLSLYVLLVPLSAWRFLKAFDREPAVALLAFPVVYGTFLFMGFVNFVSALPFLLLALAALKRWTDTGSRWTFAWLVTLSLILYFAHTQVFLLYVGSAGLYLLLAWPGWRRFLLALSHLIPSLALLGVWIVRSGVLASAESWQSGRGGRNASPAGASWENLSVSVRELPARLIDAYRDGSDDLLLVLILFAGLTLLLLRQRPRTDGVRAWLREHAIELVGVTLLALYFALPVSFKWVWPLNWRLVIVAYLVGLAWLRLPPLGRWRQLAVAIPLMAIALFGVGIHMKNFAAFQKEVGPLEEVLEQAAPRRRMMGLIYDKGSGVMSPTLAPYIHFAQYYQLRRGGMADFSFANFAQSPIQFVDIGGPPRLPLRWEWTPEALRWPRSPKGVADYYDYYLVRAQRVGRNPFGRALGRTLDSEVRKVASAGRWTLYERVWER